MRGLLITLVILVVIGVLGYMFVGPQYNRLVDEDETINGKWSEVETQYQRRFDLIDNLVATVQASADFERGTLEAVTKARASAFNAMANADGGRNLGDVNKAENQLAIAMGGRSGGGMRGMMMGYQEKYPDLQTTKQFQDLMVQIEGTENRVGKARTDFNEVVQIYNKTVRSFPMNMLAGIFGHGEREYFESVDGAETAPSVRDGFSKE
jgi:LemA protein